MSGVVKSGLIFGLVGMLAASAVALLPQIGVIVCGPAIAALIGGGAGYYGVRWSAGNVGVGSGVLAGTLAGVGTLIGALIAFTIVFRAVQSNPLFQAQLQEALSQQPNAQVDPAAVSGVLGVAGVLAGVCLGVLNLLVALAFGALGGWIAVRSRAKAAPPLEI